MKLEVGKVYLDRNGDRWLVTLGDGFNLVHPFGARRLIDDMFMSFGDTGYFINKRTEHVYDLINEAERET